MRVGSAGLARGPRLAAEGATARAQRADRSRRRSGHRAARHACRHQAAARLFRGVAARVARSRRAGESRGRAHARQPRYAGHRARGERRPPAGAGRGPARGPAAARGAAAAARGAGMRAPPHGLAAHRAWRLGAADRQRAERGDHRARQRPAPRRPGVRGLSDRQARGRDGEPGTRAGAPDGAGPQRAHRARRVGQRPEPDSRGLPGLAGGVAATTRLRLPAVDRALGGRRTAAFGRVDRRRRAFRACAASLPAAPRGARSANHQRRQGAPEAAARAAGDGVL